MRLSAVAWSPGKGVQRWWWLPGATFPCSPWGTAYWPAVEAARPGVVIPATRTAPAKAPSSSWPGRTPAPARAAARTRGDSLCCRARWSHPSAARIISVSSNAERWVRRRPEPGPTAGGSAIAARWVAAAPASTYRARGPPTRRSLARNTTAPERSISPQAPAARPAATAGGAAGPVAAEKMLDEMARLTDPAPKPAKPATSRTAPPACRPGWSCATGLGGPAAGSGTGIATARPSQRPGTCPATGPRREEVRRWRGGGRCLRRSGR